MSQDKVGILYCKIYKKIKEKTKCNTISVNELKEVIGRTFGNNHILPRYEYVEIIRELVNDFNILKKGKFCDYEIVNRPDLLKRVIKLQLQDF